MAHECEECGYTCFCDCDDLMGPQPTSCRCLRKHDEEEMRDPDYEEGE